LIFYEIQFDIRCKIRQYIPVESDIEKVLINNPPVRQSSELSDDALARHVDPFAGIFLMHDTENQKRT
jgi:hypothetical protein